MKLNYDWRLEFSVAPPPTTEWNRVAPRNSANMRVEAAYTKAEAPFLSTVPLGYETSPAVTTM